MGDLHRFALRVGAHRHLEGPAGDPHLQARLSHLQRDLRGPQVFHRGRPLQQRGGQR